MRRVRLNEKLINDTVFNSQHISITHVAEMKKRFALINIDDDKQRWRGTESRGKMKTRKTKKKKNFVDINQKERKINN